MHEIHGTLLRISKETGLPVKKILDMLFFLRGGEVENNKLVQKLGVSKNVLNQVKQKLSDLFEPPSTVTALSGKGRELTDLLFPEGYRPEEELWVNLRDVRFIQIQKLLQKYKGLRPEPFRKYDQFTATVETTARRAALIDFFADVQGKNLLFLGDDDFTSVAVSAYGTAKTVSVLDIDERILRGIRTISDKDKFQIRCERYDARGELPKKFTGAFDVVFTDPPYTQTGISLFVSRAIEALDPANLAGRIYCCYGNSDRAKERFLPIYEVFGHSGLMIRWIFDKLNRYDGAESIGSTSSLFVCDVTPKTKPVIKGDYDGAIYTG
ncbi:MAG: hypothetical protein A3F04_00120 [Candidatus Chisholmbacteria bacterium RIFCSPHIGHO2_12_FULL_49_9]|uniref:N(4)-bis(aminopropyl)spermidine synthase C-terminal domain-containing protein n=1 Tax=Candidatus Chisholmbacteria bacterium RIFCSPHIGHO2_01_FULL_52_32 TaxID=1797591 RepID=A0A1G1VSG6_9BACT|nr:MAG: hypothetical protein A2786_01960 [Candidatus Chisholmbacteria bacterium RIFCSPHIGHO2_01_FULL_52_32]OGY19121.1 MAG: hypothetical protein A3F04_00120 [Candidatus Chisholmbacteria bacterium RIFCSPHIGHO2_12_FULL_49_9]OGY20363.1 MAG: hypothetical protein A2900_04785 [Candidatus Chisholmbacteria bacterium RIFCSPLOWO2_01_FULL_50_28]